MKSGNVLIFCIKEHMEKYVQLKKQNKGEKK